MREGDARNSGGFVLSLDFELMWGVNGTRTIDQHGEHVLGARQVIPRLLDLFEQHGIGCTWATVGFLFCHDRDELLSSLPQIRPAYVDRKLSNYAYLDQVGADERRDPYHFAPSLISRIAERPRQEIGTHTLSHYYCLEDGQTAEAFRADLDAALKLGSAAGHRIRSIVFPRNQVSNEALGVCRDAGVTIYRGAGRPAGGLGVPRSRDSRLRRVIRLADSYVEMGPRAEPSVETHAGMVDVPASLFLRPFSRRMAAGERFKIQRILAAMRRAAQRGGLFHLWFHPENFGVDQERNLGMMATIAKEAARLRELHGWPSLNMAEAAAVAISATGASAQRLESASAR
ncbi:polysaccharide deacetylase family protein [Arvimicrobium flavum]|uniref:polysaccharide deacetylase family protein n=1 Tax=Arvimicrobium flavum TaxID=3393320 RepID=UPI00237A1416|nr:polysaccharide deacetylase family protein [Mesorhizobium shangrilense]